MKNKLFLIETGCDINIAVYYDQVLGIVENMEVIPIPTVFNSMLTGMISSGGEIFIVVNSFFKDKENMCGNGNFFYLVANNLCFQGNETIKIVDINDLYKTPIPEKMKKYIYFSSLYMYDKKEYAIIDLEQIENEINMNLKNEVKYE